MDDEAALAAPPSNSKLSIHLDTAYTSGAAAIINAHPRVIKIFFPCVCVNGAQLQAARDYKAGTPSGKVVLRVYTTQRFSATQDPTTCANSYWDNSLAPAINAMSSADKALIDYLEGPNEGDSTPTFGSLSDARWFNTFWVQLAQLMSNAGMKPMFGSIAVGNPAGADLNAMYALLEAVVPALQKCNSLGGGWSYHDYSGPAMTKDINTEVWYSLRYRFFYSYFSSHHPDLVNIPMVGTEGGGFYGWKSVGAAYFEDWLSWHDQQIRQDSYFLGDTLFEIGDPNGWPDFDVEPISGWLASYIAAAAPTSPPSVPTGLAATAQDSAIALTWNPSTGASTYNVKRSTTSGGPYTVIQSGLTTTSYTNTGLTNGTTYYYVVSASNSYGESANSSQASATPSTMNTNTPSGTNLALLSTQWPTDSDYSSSYTGAKAIDGVVSAVSKWTSNGNAPPHWLALDLGSTLTINGYIVRHAGAAGEYTTYNTKNFKIQSASSLNGPWADECVVDNSAQANVTSRSYFTPKSLRFIRLYITNAGADNYARIPEFEVWGVLPPAPAAPTNLTASPGNTSVTLAWDGSATAAGYKVKQAAASNGPCTPIATGVTGTTYLASGLTNGTTYYFVVSAVNSGGESADSSSAWATPRPPLVRGDFNQDNFVDQVDFGILQACLTGANLAQNDPACAACKLDSDNDVDDDDLALWLACFTGPNRPAPLNCLY